jgi:16S rRNA G966 N2-methylase RsmD
LRKIAKQLHKIRHWKILQGSYSDIDNQSATWFIDPPYMFGGDSYIMKARDINFSELAGWCKSRIGQVLVCENTKADWLPFLPMRDMRGSKFTTTEAIWSNEPHNFMSQQVPLF